MGSSRWAGRSVSSRRRGRLVSAGLIGVAALYYSPAVLERMLPRPWLRRFQRRIGNPTGMWMSSLPGWAVVETVGRRSGQPRQVPVGARLIGDNVWVVAADPRHAGYVKNIEADPKVRVKVRGRWMNGTAEILPDDNARRRMFQVNPLNGLYISIAGREHLTIRIRLDASGHS